MRFGMTTMAVEPPDRFRRLVQTAEEGGCDYLWVCDSSLHARDVYSYLTVAALASERLRIGPNCTHPYTRHPAINLNAMATIHELSGGRGIIAVATGDRPVMELGYPMARVSVVREMIEVIRALESGEDADARGRDLHAGRGAALLRPPGIASPLSRGFRAADAPDGRRACRRRALPRRRQRGLRALRNGPDPRRSGRGRARSPCHRCRLHGLRLLAGRHGGGKGSLPPDGRVVFPRPRVNMPRSRACRRSGSRTSGRPMPAGISTRQRRPWTSSRTT